MYCNKPFEVINNAVDVDKFKYCGQSREAIRKELGLSKEAYLIGNVGRFEVAKNHTFIIDVFKNIHDVKPSAVLLLVGEGSLFEEMKEKVMLLGLTEFVYFLGLRSDVERIYSAMDLFFFHHCLKVFRLYWSKHSVLVLIVWYQMLSQKKLSLIHI